MTAPQRVGLDADGSLDEVWATGVDVHVEQMDDGHWYIGIYKPGTPNGLWLHFISKKRIRATWGDDGLDLPVLREDDDALLETIGGNEP